MPGPGSSRWTGYEACPECGRLVEVLSEIKYLDEDGQPARRLVFEDHECVAEEGEEE